MVDISIFSVFTSILFYLVCFRKVFFDFMRRVQIIGFITHPYGLLYFALGG
jgi:hypothetical protein